MTPRDALAELIAAVEEHIALSGIPPTVRLRRALDAGREELAGRDTLSPSSDHPR